MTELVEYLTTLPRPKANDLLATYKGREKLIPGELFPRYENLRENELLHISHVRKCMNILLPENDNKHDWSKDELYIFITICAFRFINECVVPDETRVRYIEDHFTKEPHHPEHEILTGNDLKDQDILEMAVDRMSRNLQFNNGEYNEENMEKFCPLFHKKQEERTQLYKKYITEYKNLVKETFYSLSKPWEKAKQ